MEFEALIRICFSSVSKYLTHNKWRPKTDYYAFSDRMILTEESGNADIHQNILSFIPFPTITFQGEVVKVAYKWMGKVKKAGSMFVGTSPELELALYTLCILVRPNRGCPVQMNGHKFNIQTWVQTSDGKELVGAAFPAI